MNYADTAAQLVLGDRNTAYGNPREDFAGVALMWSGLLNMKLRERISPEEVALMMTALKLRREAHKSKPDNVIDAHGYLLTLEWMQLGDAPVPKWQTEVAAWIETSKRLVAEKQEEIDALRASEESLASTVRGLEFEIEKLRKQGGAS